MSINTSYSPPRHDILAMIPREPIDRVLDVGCSAGATGAELKRVRGVHVTGVELDGPSAQAAADVLDEVRCGEAVAELSRLADEGREFDLVVCGDVLEHLADPWAALKLIRKLVPAGWVIVSLPNVAHISTFAALARQRWPYRTRGIHDRTHLRYFGSANLPELFGDAGFDEIRRHVHHRIVERPHRINGLFEPVLRRVPILSRYTEYQFVCLLR